ncbi:hypothetical protein BLNAU_10373 [Blattamonas nauphoetae]|uniref:COMM domain-containing protein n=1 Tax=Blattamonas nauphoetae TaxID=2049346 RepID=A0ABQ9XTB5_9EUKA|nr:hypothetical protein BLNAU_10373 [Blattamonas nauphoetae]
MTQLSVNKLDNLDWRFAVSSASSDINKIGQTFLQMKMTIDGKDVFFELSLLQFFAFLSEMEKIKSQLDSFQ